ncbi:MAG TPA: M14 family zinc carboxypeptidase [Chloroflexia bacterium]|nr:M14 family zinc carboxypeptidase [Chloroflexia bacterium]
MNANIRTFSRSGTHKLIVPAVMLLLSLIIVRGTSGATPAQASAQLPAGTLAASRTTQAHTFFNGYKTVEGIYAFLDQMVAQYPDLAEKVDIGDSWCKAHPGECTQPNAYGGYDILALHISNRMIPGSKPVFWLDAGLHADEIVPPELAMRLITWLLDNYDTNADAHWLVDYQDIWILPVASPDSHHIAEAGGDQPLLQRKNANTTGCSTFNPNGDNTFGVDLNRNFPFEWACCQGASDDPCSQLYRGPSAGSENETQAIVTTLKSLIPDQRGPANTDPAPLLTTGIVESLHSFAKINFYPWNFLADFSPNHTDLDNIVAHMSAPSLGGNGYKYCQSGAPLCLGGADGSSMDWVYGDLGAAAVTTEIEGDTFTPPYSQVDPVWENNKQAFIYMAKIARTPYLTTRGPDSTDIIIAPGVINSGAQPLLSATINAAWSGNNYYQKIAGAEYYVDTPPWAGGTAHSFTPTDGNFDATTESVQATVETDGLTTGQHIIFVRGRGTETYEGNQSWGPISAIFLTVVTSGGTPVVVATPTVPHTPLPPPLPLPGTGSQTFPETGKTMQGIFLDYWQSHGGLAQQGYPISDALGETSSLDGKPYTMQYFERAVFEYHPENANTPYEVLLSQLGTFRYEQKYPEGAPSQTPNTTPGSLLFPETGKRLGGIFLDYWQSHGGLAQQGYPISDEFQEKSDLDGKVYNVQYFERAVFEHHPENANTPYEVLLSQLGTFRYRTLYPSQP